MSNFKIALISIFGICIVGGIIVFALAKVSSPGSANLTVWGTIDKDAFDAMEAASSLSKNDLITINYVEKDPTTFDTEFVEALADGKGPDIVILREDAIYKNRNRIYTVSFKSYPERMFKDTFVQEGELFVSPDGIMSFPIMIDPLVMYWNRDMFTNNLVAQPPRYWEQIAALIPTFTKKDKTSSISQSTIALGEWSNVSHAKEILSLLFLQAGTPITGRVAGGALSGVLNGLYGNAVQPSESALNFYTQFSNPTSPLYTWNRSLPNSLTFFLSGKVALYIGFASEIFTIQQKNPNLNFDVIDLPQSKEATKKTVFGHMYGVAIVKQTQQLQGAFTAVVGLTEPAALKGLETVTTLPPARRDLLADKPTDAFRSVFYNSALLSQSWVDPDSVATSDIFRDIIETVTSGRARVTEALSRANEQLVNLFDK